MPCSCGQHRTPQGCAGARTFRRMLPELRQELGRIGGIWRARQAEARLAARYASLPREQAIAAAWRDGRNVERVKQRRRNHV